jgi:putative zinc finger/helix-turn-helix YgiT family protein
MPEKTPSAGRDRPFPWRCTRCKAKEVHPLETDYSTTVEHDGRSYTIRIADLLIPTCRNCGAQTFSVGDDDRIIAALRAQVGLLTPQEIQQRRAQFQLSPQELAQSLGVAPETISRWETGALIQSRAMDNLLRRFFESTEARCKVKQDVR